MERAYAGSQYKKMVATQCRQRSRSIVLASDLDNTLVISWGNRVSSQELMRFLKEKSIPLLIVTGIDIKQILSRISTGEVPLPQAFSSDVGTNLYFLHTTKPHSSEESISSVLPSDETVWFVRDRLFDRVIRETGYNRRRLVKECLQIIQEYSEQDQYKEQFEDRLDLVFQTSLEEEKNFLNGGDVPRGWDWKISFWFFDNTRTLEKAARLAKTIRGRLGQEVVVCEEKNYNSRLGPEDRRRKYNLDLLPVTKAVVVNYVALLSKARTVAVAGDSGNDAEMLLDSGDLKIVVGGYTQELIDRIKIAFPSKDSALENGWFEANKRTWYVERRLSRRRGPQSILNALKQYFSTAG
ncbi:MAG: hypothetical protein M1150_00445 [Patescibacteria group bacterium]|nr:hypothetical protein [Patescibacteria group bacterium]